ncbi:hypothetical protein SCOR_27390 [Sulfidibacter corallicola]|uniref:Uncharacterized protein n=1 Tax=Sulfidibacter corallicola TaxID=2818388 RepID=A0A8A4TNP6_SULCO|nr:hypothetical protein [Sulfidibacter corallicola]QTD50722.1 hypothetical protein J3U87_34480 [Sulfidibacter corallicola]
MPGNPDSRQLQDVVASQAGTTLDQACDWYQQLPLGLKQAVASHVEVITEEVWWKFANQCVLSWAKLKESVSDTFARDRLVEDLSMSEQLDAVLNYFDGTIGSTSLPDLRRYVRTLATMTVVQLAERRVRECLNELEEGVRTHDFDLEHFVEHNPHGWARHYGETHLRDGGTIYHYRNLENERVHADVLEYEIAGSLFIFERFLEDEEVSEYERTFDAS